MSAADPPLTKIPTADYTALQEELLNRMPHAEFALGLVALTASGRLDVVSAAYADAWPKPSVVVIIERPDDAHIVVMTDEDAAKDRAAEAMDYLLRAEIIEARHLLSACLRSVIPAATRGRRGEAFACRKWVFPRDRCGPSLDPPSLPAGYSGGELVASHAAVVDAHWPYRHEGSEDTIKNIIERLPTGNEPPSDRPARDRHR
eukprot:CAMPEP_0196772888 /NCGR_PEP_ID=MMETSP1104-20130614/2474_1 /TAXON_ID=33652 /ORGANISM="Cafeteria sp., Strain Caron Lab Isolate" /LENGTH=202 /DNA_ID=CAMNT_0042143031 /DNA_START=6 /DNA_END=611 /DNA_ORIENTATION=+